MSVDAIFDKFSKISDSEKLLSNKSLISNKAPEKDESFSGFLKDAVKGVNDLQIEADQKIEDMVLKKNNITTHDAMIALEKADVAFQLMNAVRTRIVQAYQEVMRMQI